MERIYFTYEAGFEALGEKNQQSRGKDDHFSVDTDQYFIWVGRCERFIV